MQIQNSPAGAPTPRGGRAATYYLTFFFESSMNMKKFWPLLQTPDRQCFRLTSSRIFMFQIAIHLNSKECMEMARNNSKIMAQRRSIVQMLAIIVTVFAVCWLPINIGKLQRENKKENKNKKKSEKVNTYFLEHKHNQVRTSFFYFFQSCCCLRHRHYHNGLKETQSSFSCSLLASVNMVTVWPIPSYTGSHLPLYFTSLCTHVAKRIRRLRECNIFSLVCQSFWGGARGAESPCSVML